MNVRHLVPSVSRWVLSMGSLMLATGLQPTVHASSADLSKFRPIDPQFIAALGDPGATSGNDAQSWGLWGPGPGPARLQTGPLQTIEGGRGGGASTVEIRRCGLVARGTGLIMEKPAFSLPPGKYLVTGDRSVTTVLTIHPKDKNGNQRWELADGATLYDVTHLGCRAARYTPETVNNSCSPANVRSTGFPVTPGAAMPVVNGCRKQDYTVLIVVGLPATH